MQQVEVALVLESIIVIVAAAVSYGVCFLIPKSLEVDNG